MRLVQDVGREARRTVVDAKRRLPARTGCWYQAGRQRRRPLRHGIALQHQHALALLDRRQRRNEPRGAGTDDQAVDREFLPAIDGVDRAHVRPSPRPRPSFETLACGELLRTRTMVAARLSLSPLSMNTPLGVFMVRCAVPPRLLTPMVMSAFLGASRTMRPQQAARVLMTPRAPTWPPRSKPPGTQASTPRSRSHAFPR